MKKPIDMKMTWGSALPIYLALLQDGTEVGKREAALGLRNMAAVADQVVLRAKVESDLRQRIATLEGQHDALAAQVLLLKRALAKVKS